MEIRIGQGIDIHPFADDRKCVIGGIEIPNTRGLAGHSDADVLTHALMDALLGAIGQRDIGSHFPNSSDEWKDADSMRLLEKVWAIVNREGWSLVNADMTVLAEEPKLSPFIDEMRSRYSAVLKSAADRFAIKATTTERLGFIGRRDGIAAFAVVLLAKTE